MGTGCRGKITQTSGHPSSRGNVRFWSEPSRVVPDNRHKYPRASLWLDAVDS